VDQRQFVKVLRRDMTEAERRLWFHLRAHRFVGQKFRRQQALGPYVVDFVHFAARLIVEADGSQHGESRRDLMRDAWLTNHGFRVLRFWNDEVLQRTDAVLETIAAALQEAAVSLVTSGDAVQLMGASWQSRAVALAETAPSPQPLSREGRGEKAIASLQ
jgi:very-short-patch-repair endonuclease